MKKQSTKDEVVIQIEVNGETFTATGKTVKDAVLDIPKIEKPNTKAIIKYGRKSYALSIPFFTRLQWPSITGQVARANLIKRLTL